MSTSPDAEEKTGPGKRPAPRGTASYRRKRAVTACQVCRARRTKCDNLKPSCSFCLKTGAVCIQSAVDLSSFDPASIKILERLEVMESLVRAIPAVSDSLSPLSADSGGPAHEASPAVSTLFTQASTVLPDRLEAVLAWPLFGRSEAGPASLAPQTPQPGLAGCGPCTPAGLAGLLEDAPQTVNKLVDSFFSYVHVKNPVLDEAATRRLVSSTSIHGIDWSMGSCLYLLICALGSIATPFGPSGGTMPETAAYANAQAFFHAAEKRLGFAIGSADVVAAQCLFLSGVYKMAVFQPRIAWRFFLQAVAACQEFPFLAGALPPDCEQGAVDKDEQRASTLCQAVYWSAWKSERELRGELQLPDFALGDDDRGCYPAFFPTPPVEQERLPHKHGLPQGPAGPSAGSGGATSTAWYFYLAEISLRRLSSRVYAEILALSRSHLGRDFLVNTALAIPTWEAETQQWIDSLPAPLSFQAPAHEDDVCRFVLRGHLINLYEMIYWPFVCAVLALGPAAPHLEREFAGSPPPGFVIQLAEKGLNTHVRRIQVNEPGFRHRHHGTWPMVRTCTRSALVLAASAMILHGQREAVARIEPPLAWQQSIASVIGLLGFWEAEIPELGRPRRVLEEAMARTGSGGPRAVQGGHLWHGAGSSGSSRPSSDPSLGRS